MRWYKTSLGKKYIMGVTGLILIGFILGHMGGNLSVFAGPSGINGYAEHLRAFPPFLWGFRAVMAFAFALHIWMGITLYLENKAARPVAYAKKVNDRTSFAAQNMIWTGLLLLAFVVYHLLQFTFHTFNPEFNSLTTVLKGETVFNVYAMVSSSFHKFGIALVYAVAMIILLLHVSHGFQSFFQSLGWTNDRTKPGLEKSSRVVAFVVMLGFIIIPIAFFFGAI
ncbi:MAG: succinate dehydrogenase cytochrome b subunit [Desulfuromonadales bacterium]|jgi:succinate dehydrogenase / fumarate reductase cytochrome b subunit